MITTTSHQSFLITPQPFAICVNSTMPTEGSKTSWGNSLQTLSPLVSIFFGQSADVSLPVSTLFWNTLLLGHATGHGIVSFSFYIEGPEGFGEGGDIIVVLKTILLFYEVKNETSISDWDYFRRLPGTKLNQGRYQKRINKLESKNLTPKNQIHLQWLA